MIGVLPAIQRHVRRRVEQVRENGAGAAQRSEDRYLDAVYQHAAVAANMVTMLGEEILTHIPVASAPGEHRDRSELLAWYPHYTTIRAHLKRLEEEQRPREATFTAATSLSRLASPVNEVLGVVDGSVKWFNAKKGFGFIESPSQKEDIFVHISAVERFGLTKLEPGQQVSFQVTREEGRASASAILVAPVDSVLRKNRPS